MGEYARQYTLDMFGVDIGDYDPPPTNQIKRYACVCSKVFISCAARAQHQQATGHGKSKKQRQEEYEKGM